MPSGSLLDDLESMEENAATLNFLLDVVWNRVDVSLDRYSYSVCGLSGTFVIQDDGTVFQLSGDGVLIDYARDAESGSVDVFTITGPDGTVYTFSVKEMAYRDGRGLTSTGPMNGKLDEWTAPTAWHLTQMRSRSGLETAEFTYSEPATWNRSVRSRSETLTMVFGGDHTNPSRSISTRTVESIYDARVLTSIILDGTSVSFSYHQGTGGASHTDVSISRQNFPFRLTGMEVHMTGSDDPLYKMNVGTLRDPYDGRIVLNSLELYRDEVLDDKWNFTYNGVGRTVSACSQDWYGYYNGENEFSEEGRTILCPYEVNVSYGGSFDLTNGFPNAEYASYMSLISVDHDMAVTDFTYEGNSVNSSLGSRSIGVRVKRIILPEGQFKQNRVRYFTYEDPFVCGPSEPSESMYCTSMMSLQSTGLSASCKWQYTLHDTPVDLGPSIRDSRVYYGKVREDVHALRIIPVGGGSAPDENFVRTVYEYSMNDVYPYGQGCISRFPEASRKVYDGTYTSPYAAARLGLRRHYDNSGPSVSPVLKHREDYAYKDGEYKMVSSVDYEYDRLERNSVLVDYHATQVYQDLLAGHLTHDNVYHFPIYAWGNYGRQPVKEVRVGYHASGNDTTVVNTSYVNRRSMSKPVRVSSVTMTAGNVERQMSYGYADQEARSGDWTSVLASQHCLSTPVKRRVRYTEKSISIHVIGGNSDVSLTDLPAFPDTIIQVVTPLAPAFKEELTRYEWFNIGGQQYLLPSAHIEKNLGAESWRESVLSRDGKGNITSFKEKGGPQTVILWGYGRRLPVAVIENASISEVYEALGGREVLIEASAGLDVPSDSYIQQLADLRTELPNAHVTTYTHIPGKGVGSVTDPAGVKTTFEYDHAGRLTCIRDNDGNKVEEYDYSLMADADKRRHMRSRVYRSADGQQFSEDVRWWDVYGRTLQDISIAASGDGKDLVTAYGSDFMFHDDVKTWLPYPVQNTAGAFQTEAENAAAGYHGNELAYSFKNYELSSRDRVVSTALPG